MQRGDDLDVARKPLVQQTVYFIIFKFHCSVLFSVVFIIVVFILCVVFNCVLLFMLHFLTGRISLNNSAMKLYDE